ncbi:MAG: UPF0182 family protein [Gemmatimonadaceae bacterium]
MTRRRWVIVSIASVALVLLVGREFAGWYVEYSWFDALGASGIWKARAMNLTLMRGVTFVVGFLFVFANLFAVRSSIKALVLPQRVANLEIGEAVPSRRLTWTAVIMAAAIAALLAVMQDDWVALELVRHGEPFLESDPYFQYDLAFFVYWLPLEVSLHIGALSTLVVVALLVLVLYALTPSLRWERGRVAVTGHVRRHFFALGAVLLVLLGWRYRLDAYTLLVDGHGELGAFTALDKEFRQPANLVLALITVSAAALVLWSGWMGQARIAFAAVTLVLAGAFTVRQVIPPILQRTSLSADVSDRERPYVETRAAYSRRGFDTERVAYDSVFNGFASLDTGVQGVSALDEAPIIRDAERLRRRGRVSGTVGWDFQDGHLTALVAEQPAGPDAIDALAPWSLARSNATVLDDRGLPIFTDVVALDGATTTAPAVVHDSIGGYLTIADSLGTISAPELTSFGTRLAHAWHLQNPQLLFGDLPQPRPRIVLRRDVRERVRALYAPFLVGSAIRPIVHNDTLYWALHIYSASEWYPLSEPVMVAQQELHYLRPAGVAIVNATTGRVWAVRDDIADPIAESWSRRFPQLFVSRSSIAPEFLRKLAPPLEVSYVQARAFARFGRRGDVAPPSRVPPTTGGDESFGEYAATPGFDVRRGAMYWSVPILDAANSLRGIYIATGGGTHDPMFITTTTNSLRWPVLLERMQRAGDATVPLASRESRPIRGPVRSISHADGIAFVQTTYVSRGDGTLAVARVVVADNDSVRSGPSVMGAIGVTPASITLPPSTPEEFRSRVESHYRQMREALARSDWRAFGEAYEALGRLLRAAQR